MSTFPPVNVGRMARSGPDLQNIPLPSVWTDTSARIKRQIELTRAIGEPGLFGAQLRFKIGDLVAWKPLTKVGLWRVLEINHAPIMVQSDYAAIELKLAAAMYNQGQKNPCNEVTLRRPEKTELKPPPDEVVLEWVGGACGPVSNLTGRVIAPLNEVFPVTEMEAVAIAASGG